MLQLQKDIEVVSRPGSCRINYLHINFITHYMEVEEALCRCNKECQKLQNVRNFEFLHLLNWQASYLCGRQAGRQCESSDLNCVYWLFCSVDIRKVSRHLFVQWYKLGTVRSINQCSDHTVSLLFVVFLFVDVEQSVVMYVCLCACVRQQRPLSACDTVLCHFVNNCNTPVEQAAGDEPRTKGIGATRKP